jgi:hypothetical protein
MHGLGIFGIWWNDTNSFFYPQQPQSCKDNNISEQMVNERIDDDANEPIHLASDDASNNCIITWD